MRLTNYREPHFVCGCVFEIIRGDFPTLAPIFKIAHKTAEKLDFNVVNCMDKTY